MTQRTRELGIRVALGARRSEVIRLVVVGSLTPIVIGLAAGLAGAVGTSRALGNVLYDVQPAGGSNSPGVDCTVARQLRCPG